MTTDDPTVLIAGGGLAGLCCARHLAAAGVRCRLFEAADRVGGRVASDVVNGFIIDRGFQVLLTSYPEAQRGLDAAGLGLREFEPGALVRLGSRFRRVVDPWRRPAAALRSMLPPLLPLGDVLRLARLRRDLLAGRSRGPEAERPTAEALAARGFSDAALARFFRPFFGGVFLERELETPFGMFAFVFAMFARGAAALPAAGMGAIPAGIAGKLPSGTIETGRAVKAVEPRALVLADGERVTGAAVVVATDVDAAAGLAPSVARPGWRGTTTLSFAAAAPPVDEPLLVLDGNAEGPVNHLCVPSAVAPTYAPGGAALVSASVLGVPDADDAALERAVRAQMTGWFGTDVRRWEHLRTDRIAHALPRNAPPAAVAPERVRLGDGVYVCGDHRATASIDGAMASGRVAAETILVDLDLATPAEVRP